MTKFFIKIIEIYQKWASPDHSSWGKFRFPNGYCQYYPSCSEYTRQALGKYGIFGLLFGLYRVLRCNPFSKGGFDPIIKTNQ